MTQPNPAGGPNPWNQASYPAGTHACQNYDHQAHQLTDMNNYRQYSHPREGAAHHLFTNCWPAPGTVGISYIGWTCTASTPSVSARTTHALLADRRARDWPHAGRSNTPSLQTDLAWWRQ